MRPEKLDPEFKKKLVTALRSGEYKQGQQMLYNSNNNSLCCLGVACLITGLTKDEIAGVDILAKVNGTPTMKMEATVKALSLGYPDIFLSGECDGYGRILADMNDSGSTFFEIADYIEENL